MEVKGSPASVTSISTEIVSTSGVLAGQILCVRTIEQTGEPIRFDVSELLQEHLLDEPWIRCLVPAEQFEREDSDWAQIKHLPGIHEVGKASNDAFYEVAVCQHNVLWLRNHGFPFEEIQSSTDLEHDVLKPREGQVRVYGEWDSRQKAQSRFIRKAAEGILSGPGHGRGLDGYYRRRTISQYVLAPIEWAMVIRDIVTSPPEVLDIFLLSCISLGLQLLRDFDSPPALQLLDRDHATWIQHFHELGSKTTMRPAVKGQLDMHEISFLRGLLEFAGGEMDALQHKFDGRRSANEKLASFGDVLDLWPLEQGSLGSFDVQGTREALLRSRLFGGYALDVVGLKQNIVLYVPIGFTDEVCKTLPVQLVYNIGHGTMRGIQSQMSITYHQVPSLQKPDDDMLLFLCYGACQQAIRQAFNEWAVSPDGDDFYRQTLADLHKAQTPEETMLKVIALLWYVRLLSDTSDEVSEPWMVSEPIHGSYLWDFGRLLDGQQLRNQRAALERMALSISRVTGQEASPAILYLLNSAVDVQLPLQLHLLDALSDQYWRCRLGGRMAHGRGWKKTRSVFDEKMGHVSDSSWDRKTDSGWLLVDSGDEQDAEPR